MRFTFKIVMISLNPSFKKLKIIENQLAILKIYNKNIKMLNICKTQNF